MSPYEFTHILVPVDGSDGSHKALDCALSLCEGLGAQLTALAVEGRLPVYAATVGEVDEVRREKDEFFKNVLEGAAADAAKRGVHAETDLVPGHAAEVITHYAKAHGCDLISMTTKRSEMLRRVESPKGQRVLGTKEIILILHTDCGMLTSRTTTSPPDTGGDRRAP
jgi:nucleotide-binding universal stress UspA family protein